MFKKFEVIYSANLEAASWAMAYCGVDDSVPLKHKDTIMEDFNTLKKLFTRSSYTNRWVVKYRVTWFWFFKKEHKIFLRSRSEAGAIKQARDFVLGETK